MISPEDFYRQRLLLKTDAEKQGWVDAGFQQTGFRTILDLVGQRLPLRGLSVHDAGCGFGDIIPYLSARGVKDYVGTDVMPEMIAGARTRRPHREFRLLDLRTETPPTADVTLVCGALAFQKPNDIAAILDKLWDSSNRCLAFMSWWNVPAKLDVDGTAKRGQRVVDFFVRSIDNRLSRIEDYGIPHEAIFALFKE